MARRTRRPRQGLHPALLATAVGVPLLAVALGLGLGLGLGLRARNRRRRGGANAGDGLVSEKESEKGGWRNLDSAVRPLCR